MLKISCMDRVTNKEVPGKISEGKFLWKSIVRRRNERIGYIINITRRIVKTDYKREEPWGRPRPRYIQRIIKEQICDSHVQMERIADKNGR